MPQQDLCQNRMPAATLTSTTVVKITSTTTVVVKIIDTSNSLKFSHGNARLSSISTARHCCHRCHHIVHICIVRVLPWQDLCQKRDAACRDGFKILLTLRCWWLRLRNVCCATVLLVLFPDVRVRVTAREVYPEYWILRCKIDPRTRPITVAKRQYNILGKKVGSRGWERGVANMPICRWQMLCMWMRIDIKCWKVSFVSFFIDPHVISFAILLEISPSATFILQPPIY